MTDHFAGKQVVLRPFTTSDLTDEYVGWLNDPEVTRFSNQRFIHHTLQSCQAYRASFAGTSNLFLSIVLKEGERRVGTMTAYRNLNHGTADVGIMIGDKSCWGKGIGQDAWNTMLERLSLDPNIRKITAGTAAPNVGMLRLMDRSGMKFEGRRAAQEVIEGKAEDIVYYARFNN